MCMENECSTDSNCFYLRFLNIIDLILLEFTLSFARKVISDELLRIRDTLSCWKTNLFQERRNQSQLSRLPPEWQCTTGT